jgi:hypothetical protein
MLIESAETIMKIPNIVSLSIIQIFTRFPKEIQQSFRDGNKLTEYLTSFQVFLILSLSGI